MCERGKTGKNRYHNINDVSVVDRIFDCFCGSASRCFQIFTNDYELLLLRRKKDTTPKVDTSLLLPAAFGKSFPVAVQSEQRRHGHIGHMDNNGYGGS